jgi:drug/metabolite transporter (DMT)-like permease
MYIIYIFAYNYLAAWQIALFTIFTPLYVTLIGDAMKKRFRAVFLIAALLSVAGAAIIIARDLLSLKLQIGFILMQISNFCFALGQVWYKKFKTDLRQISDVYLFSWLYLGAFIVSGVNSFLMTNWTGLQITNQHILVLLYLGILASGVCFFLWNHGATMVNTGTLAVLNNLKVPLGVLFAIVIFGEAGNWPRLLTGGAVIFIAIYLTETFKNKQPAFSLKSK